MNFRTLRARRFAATSLGVLPFVTLALLAGSPAAQEEPKPDESKLGTFVVKGHQKEHVTKLAVLPSISAYQKDALVATVVRRDLELTGLFDVIPKSRAPEGLYDFDDPVDVKAWRAIGAEVIVKVAARPHDSGKVEVLGLAYFLNVGKDPVYEKKLLVDEDAVRVTAHRITDALLSAVTGTPGSFASRLTYTASWGGKRVVLTMDADGFDPQLVSDLKAHTTAPTWGPEGSLLYAVSRDYAPYRLHVHGQPPTPVKVPMGGSVYGADFSPSYEDVAISVGEGAGTAVYRGKVKKKSPLVVGDWKKVSQTPIAVAPSWSTEGHLAWVGADPDKSFGGRRVYVDGQPVSPSGFTASTPVFCDTDLGVRLVYSVGVGSNADLVMSDVKGGGIVRLTQNQGRNTAPACSPDGRLLAFFSTRKRHGGKPQKPALYLMSLKRWSTVQLSSQFGSRLDWAPLPPAEGDAP